MSAKTFINDAGAWRRIKEVWINDAGTWRKTKFLWVKKNGVWRKIYQSATQLTISADTQDYDLFVESGSPVTDVDIVLTINLGIVVSSTLLDQGAIYASSPLPVGSKLKIINKGKIIGTGGVGGSHVNLTTTPPTGGGVALQLPCDAIIDNMVGLIAGGGGGGGCGCRNGTSYFYVTNGYAGGGGAGSNSVAGTYYSNWANYYAEETRSGSATAGTLLARGLGKSCNFWGDTYADSSSAAGGNLGSPGATPPAWSTGGAGTAIVAGGAAGRAIDRNGYALSILSGENASQIKGAYD